MRSASTTTRATDRSVDAAGRRSSRPACPAPAAQGSTRFPRASRRSSTAGISRAGTSSRITHQGSTPDVRVEDGVLVLRQQPYGQGGLLLTDRRYRNFELYLEAKPDWGCNGGIVFRSSEGGSAYQIELDQGNGTGNLFGDMLHDRQARSRRGHREGVEVRRVERVPASRRGRRAADPSRRSTACRCGMSRRTATISSPAPATG